MSEYEICGVALGCYVAVCFLGTWIWCKIADYRKCRSRDKVRKANRKEQRYFDHLDGVVYDCQRDELYQELIKKHNKKRDRQ